MVPDSGGPTPVAHNFPLINSLLATSEPQWRSDVSPPLKEEAVDSAGPSDINWLTDLNDSQKEAIRFCLTAENVACIHGPPGVGAATRMNIQTKLMIRLAKRTPWSS